MKNRIMLICFIAFSLTVFSQGKKKVRNTFKKYKEAILTDKGSEALKVIDSRTIKYYSTMATKIRKADSLEIDKMPIVDKLTLLMLKHRAPLDSIKQFTGKSLFIYAINKGMVGKNGIVNTSIGGVEISNDFATGEFVVNKEKTPFKFHFYKEGGSWKIDITHLFSMGSMAFKKMIADSKMTENEFMLHVLELTTGRKPTNEVWMPIVE